MIKWIFFNLLVIVFLGCAGSSINISSNPDSTLSKQLLAQKEQSDKEVQKLEAEIAKLEADKEKYEQDYETYDNNPILDELDETLSDKKDQPQEQPTKEEK